MHLTRANYRTTYQNVDKKPRVGAACCRYGYVLLPGAAWDDFYASGSPRPLAPGRWERGWDDAYLEDVCRSPRGRGRPLHQHQHHHQHQQVEELHVVPPLVAR